jgi:hypothetical protein
VFEGEVVAPVGESVKNKNAGSATMKTVVPLIVIACLMLNPGSTLSQQKVSFRPELSSPEDIRQWDIDGTGSWTVRGGALVLLKAGVPGGPIRRPAAFAIFRTPLLQRVTVEADIRSTAPLDVVRRDLDFVIAYESPTRFYYIHLAGITDNVHNGIFLVNNADRVRIDAGTGKPQLTDTTWHHVRVEHDGISGRIRVFVGSAPIPVLEAVDTTISCGRVGFGSFDDTGEFGHIKVTGTTR